MATFKNEWLNYRMNVESKDDWWIIEWMVELWNEWVNYGMNGWIMEWMVEFKDDWWIKEWMVEL